MRPAAPRSRRSRTASGGSSSRPGRTFRRARTSRRHSKVSRQPSRPPKTPGPAGRLRCRATLSPMDSDIHETAVVARRPPASSQEETPRLRGMLNLRGGGGGAEPQRCGNTGSCGGSRLTHPREPRSTSRPGPVALESSQRVGGPPSGKPDGFPRHGRRDLPTMPLASSSSSLTRVSCFTIFVS